MAGLQTAYSKEEKEKVIIHFRSEVRGSGKRIAFCESDPRIFGAMKFLQEQNLATPVFVGEQIEGFECIEIDPFEYDEKYAQMRAHKGETVESAREALKDPALFACMLLKEGRIDGLVCGATWPTAHTLKAALSTVRGGLASSYFIMRLKEKDVIFADCAFNIKPNAEQIAELASNTARETERLGIPPRIAMLSFSTKGSADHEDAHKMAKAAHLVQEEITMGQKNWKVDGEIQLDAAVAKEVADSKAPGSPLQGDANIFIFPDLNAGNIGYKLVERFAGAEAIGPILTGFAKPVNDLSRGSSVEEIVDVACITAWQSMQ